MNKEKICAYCGQPFIPNSNQQIYCKRPHYMKCPVCGKDYLVTYNEKLKFPPVACSYACRQAKARQTNLEKYGAEVVFQTENFKEKSKETNLKKYGVEYALSSKEIQEKSKQTLLEKYGVDNAMKSTEIQKKVEKTNLAKYGSKTFLTSEEGKKIYAEQLRQKYSTDHPLHSEQIRQKQIQTNIKKYGSNYFVQSEQGKQKIRQVVQTKYGVSSITQLDSVKEKMKETFLNHYGTDNPSKNKNIKKKIKQSMIAKYGADNCMSVPTIRQKIIQTNIERYGVPFAIMSKNIRNNGGAISKLNKEFITTLQYHNLECSSEFRLNNMSYDIMIPKFRLLIELNPTYTHNVIGNHWSSKGLRLNYHSDKAKIAHDNQYDIRCVFDWDSKNELISELVNMSETHSIVDPVNYILSRKAGCEFLRKYGRARISQYPRKTMIFGTVCEDKIVQAIAIGLNNVTRSHNHTEYQILNYGTEWSSSMDKGFNSILTFINEFIPLDDISIFIDSDRFRLQDIADLNLNVNSIQRTNPTMYWSKKTTRIPTRAKCNDIDFIEDGWLPVEDCGQISATLCKPS